MAEPVQALPDAGRRIAPHSGLIEHSRRLSPRAMWWLVLVAVWVIGALYTLFFLDRGWIPHDEGTLAHSAERVLAGELPHRDFSDPYTGGLSYLHALAFRVLGVHLLALRWTLFAAFFVWVPVLYYAASRLVTPLAAGGVALIAIFWSVPNYPAAMPSWYNLFLATGGVAALMAYIDSSHRRWLLVAGLAGGLSTLVKTTGLYFVGAGLLALLFHESRAGDRPLADRQAGLVLRLAVSAPMVAAAVAVLAFGVSRGRVVDVYQFAMPGIAIIGAVAWGVFRAPGLSVATARRVGKVSMLYLLAAAVPIAAFTGWYAIAGAVPDLIRGVFTLPARRLTYATRYPPAPWAILPMLLVAFVAVNIRGRRGIGRLAVMQPAVEIFAIAVALVPMAALVAEGFIWSSLAESTPVVVTILAILTARSIADPDVDRRARSRAVLVGCTAALCSLVQYPFAAPIYFSYGVPLVLLAVVAMFRSIPLLRRRALPGLICYYLAFGALYVTPLQVHGLRGPVISGNLGMVSEDLAVLDLPRGGLRIQKEEAAHYAKVVQLLRSHAATGVIFAGPDAPEVYFLSELQNPTPAIFDFLVPDTLFHEHLVQRLDSNHISAVAIKHSVWHSPKLAPTIEAALARRFPAAEDVGPITVRWQP